MDLLINPKKVKPNIIWMPGCRFVLPRGYFGREIPDYDELKKILVAKGHKDRWRQFGADLTITATTVIPGTNATTLPSQIAGTNITGGMPVYQDKSPVGGNQYWPAVNTTTPNSNGQLTYLVAGFAIVGGAQGGTAGVGAGQLFHVQTGGQIKIGAGSLTIGTEYFLSANAGNICPLADVASGHQVYRLGYVDPSLVTALQIDLKNLGLHP